MNGKAVSPPLHCCRSWLPPPLSNPSLASSLYVYIFFGFHFRIFLFVFIPPSFFHSPLFCLHSIKGATVFDFVRISFRGFQNVGYFNLARLSNFEITVIVNYLYLETCTSVTVKSTNNGYWTILTLFLYRYTYTQTLQVQIVRCYQIRDVGIGFWFFFFFWRNKTLWGSLWCVRE